MSKARRNKKATRFRRATARQAKRRSAKKTRKSARLAGASAKRTQKKSDASFDIPRTKIRVVGVGGGGSNIVEEIASRVPRADFFAANTDMQDLKKVSGKVRVFPFGQKLTRGLGCGMDAGLGEQAARSEKDRIKKLFEGQDISILIASLGGGTGSGAVPVFAEAAREAKNLVLGIFTLPFEFEGKKRKDIANLSLEKLRPLVNAYTVIPNEQIFKTIEKVTPFPQALSQLNRNLADSLGGLIDALHSPGLINIDFADVRSVLEGRGRLAYAAAAVSAGPERAKGALNALFANSLHEYGVEGADRILFHLVADKNVKMHEVADVSRGIFSLNPKARIILGITLRPEFRDKLRIMLFAVGCVEGLPAGKAGKQPFDKLRVSREPEKKTMPTRLAKVSAKRAGRQSVEPRKKPRMVQKKTRRVKKILLAGQQEKTEEIIERTRKNALDLKQELDGKLQEIQEEEKKWDVPAFLRVKVKR
ncbi:MAG: hypothetical protein HY458_00845 [Parcubacteria group bacterium]|nr:hypothetical protein [Parcubacteria group bacterium]